MRVVYRGKETYTPSMCSTTDPNSAPNLPPDAGDAKHAKHAGDAGAAKDAAISDTVTENAPGVKRGISDLVADHYDALRALAERQLIAERSRTGQQTISPTSLLGETFRRLVQQETKVANRDHLAAIATMLFIRIIADRRRRKLTLKRGGHATRQPIGEVEQRGERSPEEESVHMSDVDVLHDKLAELAQISPRRAEALSLHTIGGITIPNVAKLLNVSVATVERDLALSRAWLAAQMR